MAMEITSANFQTEVLESDVPVLVDFWAVWCGPCMTQGPIVEQVAEQFQGKARVGKLDVEAAGDIASKYGVMAIPTLMLFKNGEVVERMTGLRQAPELAAVLEKHL